MGTSELSNYLDRVLNLRAVQDDSLNGLQVENRAEVDTAAFAVDVSVESVRIAKQAGAQFLFVHHGLFWGKPSPLTGSLYHRVRSLMEADISLYAAHLPLDMHPVFGNNAQLAKLMGWKKTADFGEYHEQVIGKSVRFGKPVPLHDISKKMGDVLRCDPVLWNFGGAFVKHAAVISGGAISMIDQVIRCGLDTLITGEPEHVQYWKAKECGINVLFYGHYLTETVGVKALQQKVKKDLKLNTVFIDLPTGY
jgi:dinuclear metal center YbgI/SA1388 family protein